VDFSRPLLSYSVPLGLYQDRSSHRVLLDFHLANVTLGPTSYRVRLELDGESPVDFMHWSPVWLEGLAPGSHSVKLSLLNAEGRSVPGPYNVVEHTFRIQREE
jgi:hypothetical protein